MIKFPARRMEQGGGRFSHTTPSFLFGLSTQYWVYKGLSALTFWRAAPLMIEMSDKSSKVLSFIFIRFSLDLEQHNDIASPDFVSLSLTTNLLPVNKEPCPRI